MSGASSHYSPVNHVANGYSRSVNQVTRWGNDHLLRDVAHPETKILDHRPPNLDDQAFHDLNLETRGVSFNAISANGQGRSQVNAFAVGFDNPFQPGRPIAQSDPRAGHNRALRIQDSALQSADRLGVKRREKTEEQEPP